MIVFKKLLIVLIISCFFIIGFSQTADEYITRAESFNQVGNLEQAVKVMEEAVQKYPDNSSVHSYLGLYLGTKAGKTKNFMEAGPLMVTGFEMLDKAVALDANNPVARFHRGLMEVKVPFFNRLDQGIQDLELMIKIGEQSGGKLPVEMMSAAYDFLAEGYQNKQDKEKTLAAYKKVVEIAPATPLAKKAEANIAKLSRPEEDTIAGMEKYTDKHIDQFKQALSKEPDNPDILVRLGKAYLDTGNFDEAKKALEKAIQIDSTKVEAYKLLIQTIGEIAAQGYDERIYDDTNFRTNLAFGIVELADKAVKIAPDDLELKLMRGRIGVMMPFFVDKLDQAMEDLNLVKNNAVSKELKAEAILWLGIAFQKKATTSWIEVVTSYPQSSASQQALQTMRPGVKHFNRAKYKKPFLMIDFLLGFRDELPPQTAVWIEDKSGKFIKTVYVSGFSGFAKEKQVNLSSWSESSHFKDVDGVTGASIDLGQHIYVWDLKDSEGKKVKPGEYMVKIEVMYWPSMEYECSSAPIKIGKNEEKVVFKEGKLIPYAEVKYFAD
jgi:tetratricopeptide (TPR) repeat protein